MLRRPFAICGFDKTESTVDFAFFTKGGGTLALSKLKVGETVDVLLPLGNGFPDNYDGEKVMLIGGGIGVFPLLPCIAKTQAYTFLGFRSASHAILVDEFRVGSKELYLASDDGTIGTKGYITDLARKEFDAIKPKAIFCCGPHAMFKAVKRVFEGIDVPIYVSTEERMGCGFGVCMCCSQPVGTEGKTENKLRVCLEGPVFMLEEVIR